MTQSQLKNLRSTRLQRGFSMLAAVMLMALLAVIAIAVLSLSAADRRRAIRLTRTENRESCVNAGLTYARTYFANNVANWPTYLSRPQQYNPMVLPTTTPAWSGAQVRANIGTAAGITAIKAMTNGTQQFLDLDADGNSDVFIFIRDNYDEFPPAAVNFQRDNDQNVIVGAVCISPTMAPKRDDNTIDPDRMVIEALLSVNQTANSGGGPCIDQNKNNC